MELGIVYSVSYIKGPDMAALCRVICCNLTLNTENKYGNIGLMTGGGTKYPVHINQPHHHFPRYLCYPFSQELNVLFLCVQCIIYYTLQRETADNAKCALS